MTDVIHEIDCRLFEIFKLLIGKTEKVNRYLSFYSKNSDNSSLTMELYWKILDTSRPETYRIKIHGLGSEEYSEVSVFLEGRPSDGNRLYGFICRSDELAKLLSPFNVSLSDVLIRTTKN
jgi:hypothetical protein